MRFTDAVAILGHKHRYRVIAVNAVDEKSKPVPNIATDVGISFTDDWAQNDRGVNNEIDTSSTA